MQRNKRLEQLEASVGRAALDNIPDSEVDDYCNTCLGPGAYRRRLDAARARLFAAGWNGISGSGIPGETQAERSARHAAWAAEAEKAHPHCRGCGGETIAATVARVRPEAGLA